MADLPLTLEAPLGDALSRALDAEGKIPRALDALGPLVARDVVLIDGGPIETRRLTDIGARLTAVAALGANGKSRWPLADGQADALVASWSAFRGIEPADLL